jgi:hypothetical protein
MFERATRKHRYFGATHGGGLAWFKVTESADIASKQSSAGEKQKIS